MSHTTRARVQATCAGEILDYILSWTMSFFNAATIRRLMPADLLVDDLEMFPAQGSYGITAHTSDELERLIAFNRRIDRVAMAVGKGANQAFGHGGPGEFNNRIVENG